MAEYIQREAAMSVPVLPKEHRVYQTFNLDDVYETGWYDALAYLKHIPSDDVAPVRHSRWEWNEIWEVHPETHSCDLFSFGWFCTECGIELGDYLTEATGQTVIFDDDFFRPRLRSCPNCGARMDGGADHEAD